MRQELNRVTAQGILEKIQRLEPQQIAEAIDFIDFLVRKSLKGPPLMQLLCATAGARVGLEEVRRRLAKIPGNMSETVQDLRDERGCGPWMPYNWQ
jgi:hypothetical protein